MRETYELNSTDKKEIGKGRAVAGEGGALRDTSQCYCTIPLHTPSTHIFACPRPSRLSPIFLFAVFFPPRVNDATAATVFVSRKGSAEGWGHRTWISGPHGAS